MSLDGRQVARNLIHNPRKRPSATRLFQQSPKGEGRRWLFDTFSAPQPDRPRAGDWPGRRLRHDSCRPRLGCRCGRSAARRRPLRRPARRSWCSVGINPFRGNELAGFAPLPVRLSSCEDAKHLYDLCDNSFDNVPVRYSRATRQK